MEQEDKKEFVSKAKWGFSAIGIGGLVFIFVLMLLGFLDSLFFVHSVVGQTVMVMTIVILSLLALAFPFIVRTRFTSKVSYIGYYFGLIVLPIVVGALIFGACMIIVVGSGF